MAPSSDPPGAILLATEHVAKQRQLAWLLENWGLTPVTPQEVGLALQVTEGGRSHRANAARKAKAWSRAFGGLAIASDGGLVIPALGPRWKSWRTRRFAGERASDRDRARALLALMAPFTGEKRTASWKEAVAIARAGSLLTAFEAESGPGIIADAFVEEDIRDGFWVGGLWSFPTIGKSYARLTPEEREQVGDHWTALKGRVQEFFRRWGMARPA